MSGRVSDEAGAPVPFARIELHYSGDRSKGSPDCNSLACWRIVEADAGGFYAAEFEPVRELLGGVGFVNAITPGFDLNLQIVPDGAPDAGVSLRLRRERVILPGTTLDLDVGPDSTRCTDREDIWVLDHRCAMVTMRIDREGTLRIATRTAVSPPLLFGHTSNDYRGPRRLEPGALEVPVRVGTYWFFVGLPDGQPSQRIEVSTTLQ